MLNRMTGSPGMVAYGILAASAFMALLAAVGLLTLPGGGSPQADCTLSQALAVSSKETRSA